jgi:hypothetical protein
MSHTIDYGFNGNSIHRKRGKSQEQILGEILGESSATIFGDARKGHIRFVIGRRGMYFKR